jgi:hypothetical protein
VAGATFRRGHPRKIGGAPWSAILLSVALAPRGPRSSLAAILAGGSDC